MMAPTVSSCEMRGRRAPVGPLGLLLLPSVVANGLTTPDTLAPSGGVGVPLLVLAPPGRVGPPETAVGPDPVAEAADPGAALPSSGGVPAPPVRDSDMENLSYFNKATDEIVGFPLAPAQRQASGEAGHRYSA